MIYLVSNQSEFENVESIARASFNDALEYLKTLSILGFDTETEGSFNHVNKILLLQLGSKEHQYVFDFQSLTLEERNRLESDIFMDRDKIKIAHNAVFDILFLFRHGMKGRSFYDTMLAEKILNAGLTKEKGYYSLYATALRYFNVQLNKEVRGMINKKSRLSTSIVKYAAEDVEHLEDIRRKQMLLMQTYRLASEDCQDLNTVCGLEMQNLLVFASYTYNGALIDTKKLKEADNKAKEEILRIEAEIVKYIHNDERLKQFRVFYQDMFTPLEPRINLNLNSPVQKLKALRKIYPDIEDTSERTLSRYKNSTDSILIKLLLEYNKFNKIRTAFTDKLGSYINPKTGRIHPSYNQILDTGRVSSSNPNIQQIPARSEIGGEIRKCFVPSKGYKMVGGDFSGAELRVIAEFSKDPVWVQAFLNKEDLHSKLCALTFGVDIKYVKSPTPFKPNLSYREIQKILNFGLAYGMSHFKLADTLEIPEEQAEKMINDFFNRVPKVKLFLERNAAFGRKYGYITTPPPYRRRRWFEGHTSQDYSILAGIERKAKNTPIQGCNADFTKLAQVHIYNYIEENNLPIRMLFPVHDEIQTEALEYLAEEWAKKMSELMVKAAQHVLKIIPMSVDCSVADYWSK